MTTENGAQAYADEYARSLLDGDAPDILSDDDREDTWKARMEPGRYEAFMAFKTYVTFENWSSPTSVFRSAHFSDLQKKLARHYADFGDRVMAAPCNQFPAMLKDIGAALKIFDDYKNTELAREAPIGQKVSAREMIAYQACRILDSLSDDEREKRLRLEISLLGRQRRAILRRIEVSIQDGSIRDYTRIDEMCEKAGPRPLVGVEVARVLRMLPEQHRELYEMGRSTEGGSEQLHLQTIATNHPIAAMMGNPELSKARARKGGGFLDGLFSGRDRNNFQRNNQSDESRMEPRDE